MTADPTVVFEHCVKQIEDADAKLGYRLGWRFLYSPKATFGPHAELMLMGLNPGGGDYEPPAPSVESGNAYRVEHWPRTRLQEQVRILFQGLASWLGHSEGWADLLDHTLTSNACPFRSPDWASLPDQKQAKGFSIALWAYALSCLDPKLMLCCGQLLGDGMLGKALRQAGYVRQTLERTHTGWANQHFWIETHGHETKRDLLTIQFPHFSSYTLMTTDTCQPHVAEVLDRAASWLQGS